MTTLSTFSKERLTEIAQITRENKAIRLWDLMYILAEDGAYDDILLDLWKLYNLDSMKPKPPHLYKDLPDSKAIRAGRWYWLLARMANITEEAEFCFKNLPKRKSLPLYYSVKDGFRQLDVEEPRKWDHFVKLEDFEDLLNNIKKIHNLQIPLPSRLFPIEDQEQKTVEGESKTELEKTLIFISRLKVKTETDTSINFQEPGKKAVPYDYRTLTFFNRNGVIWKDFLRIVESGEYHLGPSAAKEYETKRKRLRVINQKLVKFLNHNFGLRLPKNFKLYEHCKGEKPGTYRFKFETEREIIKKIQANKYKHLTKDKVLEILKEKAPEYRKLSGRVVSRSLTLQEEAFMEKIHDICNLAFENNWLSQKEIAQILH